MRQDGPWNELISPWQEKGFEKCLDNSWSFRCFKPQMGQQNTWCDEPKATVQQSLLASPSTGCMLATGESRCRGSHTFTVPTKKDHISFIEDILLVTSRQTKVALMYRLCFRWQSQARRRRCRARRRRRCYWQSPCGPSRSTRVCWALPGSYTIVGLKTGESKKKRHRWHIIRDYHMFRFPSKSPVAMCLWRRDEAPKVPHLMGLAFSTWNINDTGDNVSDSSKVDHSWHILLC